MLGRFYAICDCCACCCGVTLAHQHGMPVLASSGDIAAVDADLCAVCGICAGYCQFAAIPVDDGLGCTDASAYMGCDVCVSHCPQEAISVLRDSCKGEPLEIEKLIVEAVTTGSIEGR